MVHQDGEPTTGGDADHVAISLPHRPLFRLDGEHVLSSPCLASAAQRGAGHRPLPGSSATDSLRSEMLQIAMF
jgi:hypothetical protein